MFCSSPWRWRWWRQCEAPWDHDSQAVWSIQWQRPLLPSLPCIQQSGLAQQQAALPLLHIRSVYSHQPKWSIICLWIKQQSRKQLFYIEVLSCVLFFFSATYQKIKPMLHTSGGLERGSNYCVTLVVGDKSSDGTSSSRGSEPPLLATAGWQRDTYQDSALRSYASLPRPRNKSVFKKFFGKRDL